jgi:hypothetical protein
MKQKCENMHPSPPPYSSNRDNIYYGIMVVVERGRESERDMGYD